MRRPQCGHACECSTEACCFGMDRRAGSSRVCRHYCPTCRARGEREPWFHCSDSEIAALFPSEIAALFPHVVAPLEEEAAKDEGKVDDPLEALVAMLQTTAKQPRPALKSVSSESSSESSSSEVFEVVSVEEVLEDTVCIGVGMPEMTSVGTFEVLAAVPVLSFRAATRNPGSETISS